jgi:hypothetical protein
MLHGMGLETGVDLEALILAGQVAERIIGRKLPGKVHQAGLRGRAPERCARKSHERAALQSRGRRGGQARADVPRARGLRPLGPGRG